MTYIEVEPAVYNSMNKLCEELTNTRISLDVIAKHLESISGSLENTNKELHEIETDLVEIDKTTANYSW